MLVDWMDELMAVRMAVEMAHSMVALLDMMSVEWKDKSMVGYSVDCSVVW